MDHGSADRRGAPHHASAGWLAAAGAAIITTDLDGRIRYWNHAAEELYGWSATEVLGRDIVELNAAPAALPHAEEIMRQVRAGGQWSGEFEVQHRDGSMVPALVTNAPYLDAAGKPAGIIGVSVSVEELHEARATAQQRASQQAAVAELSRAALAGLDLEEVMAAAIGAVQRELGVPLVKILAHEPERTGLLLRAGVGWEAGAVGHERVPADHTSQASYTLQQDHAVIVDDLASDTRFNGPELLTRHGVVSGMSTPIRGVGRDFGILSAHTTVARSFGLEEASFLDSVAGVVGAAIARLQVEEQLRTMVQRLERSEEIRVAFLRATSHELRTPLSAIVGLAETLQIHAAALDDEQRSSLTERLTVNATRLTRLINDLLDVDRLSSGLIGANRQLHDLEQLVRRVTTDHDPTGHHLELDLAPVVAEVDPPKLERVVANLVANATRHTPLGGTVHIRLRQDDAGAVLSVEDEGDGIDPAYLDQIFEPFVQGPAQQQAAQPGTGLGLTLARELVALHGGSLTAVNRAERGARFEVVLPVAAP